MKPPMPYFGGKQTTASAIVSLFPSHDCYIEPFGGGLSVLLAKQPEPMEVANDIDGDLVNFWRVLRDRTEDLMQACELTPHSRAELSLDVSDSVDEVERARRVWVQLTQGRSGTLKGTGWRHYLHPGTASTYTMPMYLDGYRRRLHPAAERLRNVSLESRPALECIEAYGRPGALLYVDPPYLGSTRNSSGYRHEMKDAGDHVELIEALLRSRAAIVLSGYASDLYDEALSSWHRYEMGTRTQGADRVEVVWSNTTDESALFSLAACGRMSADSSNGDDQ